MDERPVFHLAFPVHDIGEARRFYCDVLGCGEGRSSDDWIDFDLHGHQIVAHRVAAREDAGTNPVDGDQVPIPHFGLVLSWDDWEALAAKIRAEGLSFQIDPRVRFEGTPGEQGTFFIRDPSGNALEFKAFRDPSKLFASD
jgi:extradiol dioxygenase family protein